MEENFSLSEGFGAILKDSAVALAQHLLPGYSSTRAHGCPTPDPECIPVLAPLGVGESGAHVTCLHSGLRRQEIHQICTAVVMLKVSSGTSHSLHLKKKM